MHPNQFGLFKAAYSPKETMAVLSVGRTFLYELVKSKKLKLTKVGKKSLFLAPDIAEFLNSIRSPAA